MLTAQLMATMDDEYLVAVLHAEANEMTSTDIECELLKRFERLLKHSNVISIVKEHEISDDEVEALSELLANGVGIADLSATVALLDEFSATEPGTLRAKLERADEFYNIANDAGDVDHPPERPHQFRPVRSNAMFPMTLTVRNAAQLTAIMALNLDALESKPAAVAIENAKTEKVIEKKSEPAKTPAKTADTPLTATAGADAAQETKAGAQDSTNSTKSDDVVTLEVLKTAFLALVNTNREKAKAVLTKFNLPSKLSEATPDQYGAIFAAIKAA